MHNTAEDIRNEARHTNQNRSNRLTKSKMNPVLRAAQRALRPTPTAGGHAPSGASVEAQRRSDLDTQKVEDIVTRIIRREKRSAILLCAVGYLAGNMIACCIGSKKKEAPA
jgi:hypothetical protein